MEGEQQAMPPAAVAEHALEDPEKERDAQGRAEQPAEETEEERESNVQALGEDCRGMR